MRCGAARRSRRPEKLWVIQMEVLGENDDHFQRFAYAVVSAAFREPLSGTFAAAFIRSRARDLAGT
jgi:hypothetical protein